MNTAQQTSAWWYRLSWLWIVLFATLIVFSNGRWQFAIAALASLFLVRLFLFSQPAVRGLLVVLPVQIVAYVVMWREVIPAPGVLYYIIAASYGLCYFLPFVIDRLISGRIKGFASTLVLPLSWYLVEILIQRFTPYGSWSSLAYTQMGHGLLMPLGAWIGVAGVAFTTVWIASVGSWLVTSSRPLRYRVFNLALWAGSIALLIWVANISRLSDAAVANTLSAAVITPSYELTSDLDRAMRTAMQTGDVDPATLVPINELAIKLNSDLMSRSRNAARDGARLIVWSETAGRVLANQERNLIAQGQALALQEDVYVFMGLGVWHPGQHPPLENKVVSIVPGGEIVWQYRKARPIVGAEAHLISPGHNELPTLDTSFGRIGLVICHDLDFADYVAQAGRKNVDLLLAPSADWAVIADLHARMGIMRAVENGFWLLRPAYAGLSVIASPEGDVIRSEYDAELEARVFVAQIPVKRVSTIYPHIRFYLPIVAIALFAGLLVIALRNNTN